MEKRLLSIYLADHLAGSRGAVELARRSMKSNEGSPLGDDLMRVVREIEEDRATLEELMEMAGVGRAPVKDGAVWLVERLARLKLNGRLLAYSPLSRLEELEVLRLGIEGKRSLWRNLSEIRAEVEGWEGVDFAALIERAEGQIDVLESHRIATVRQAFFQPTTV
ncbi:MAG TPA: hypothetical protein VF058_00220 [Actinomycetota bacterium]